MPSIQADEAPHPERPPSSTLCDVTLSYTVGEGVDERTINAPLIRAELDGVETLLLLDTGASDSVFMTWLADAIDVTRAPSEAGIDHTGASVTTSVATRPVSMQIGTHTQELHSLLIIDGPPPFEGWGIGGIVSPQLLAGHDWSILDLQKDRLLIVEGDEVDIVSMISAEHSELEHLELARLLRTGDAARLIIVEAHVHGRSLAVMLNSGARRVETSPSLGLSAREEETAIVRGVADVTADAYPGLEAFLLRFGGTTLNIDDYIIREQDPAYDIQLGSAVLKGSVLLLHANAGVPLHWWR